MGIHLLSVSGHKIYGPKGVGALFVSPDAEELLTPIIFGGGQERGLRSGTVPVPLCMGLGAACEIAIAELEQEQKRIRSMRDRFLALLSDRIAGLRVNGGLQHRLAGNLNVEIPGVPAEGLLTRMQDTLSVSNGSACTSGIIEASHVLLAIGLSDQRAACSIRVSIGRFTTDEEIDFAAETISINAERLKAA
jgi:cysteine desulfurase